MSRLWFKRAEYGQKAKQQDTWLWHNQTIQFFPVHTYPFITFHECFPTRRTVLISHFQVWLAAFDAWRTSESAKWEFLSSTESPLKKPSVHTSRNGSYMLLLHYYIPPTIPTYTTDPRTIPQQFWSHCCPVSQHRHRRRCLSGVHLHQWIPWESMGLHKVGCNHNHYTRYTSGIPSGNLT